MTRNAIDRRQLIRQGMLSGAALSFGKLADFGRVFAQEPSIAASDTHSGDPWRRGTRIGELAFQAEPADPPHIKHYSGLDARLYTDFSSLTPDRMVTPNAEFYIRTAAPDRLDLTRPWHLDLGGLVAKPMAFPVAALETQVSPQGIHLMECAGNTRRLRFGLLSAAEWSGVPLEQVLARAEPLSRGTSVLVEGFDDHSMGSTTSRLGCSWIFPLDSLLATGAFLATHMNGQELTLDHGAPLRLMVPGWYGCCCVKWVQRIMLVDNDQQATSQMLEFAGRTHQKEAWQNAADYQPATIVRSAMPVRVEQWRLDGKTRYRVVGVDWGGDRVTGKLRIRFRPSDPYVLIDQQDPANSGTSWSLWSHVWSPPEPGPYLIQIEVDDPSVATPRLDAGHFIRGVKVTEV